jgi:hypothetical protein
MPPTYDFDFQRYVARRKGAREAERREGAGYAYAGDVRVRRALARLRPVTLALEATVRLWRASARAELVGTAVRVSERSFPRVLALTSRAAERLHVLPPQVYVSPHPDVSLQTFGTDDEPLVLLHAGLAESLTDGELLHGLGVELGRIQNNHVLPGTAYHFLRRASTGFAGWIVRPATIALAPWSRRAQVTADRAGLLATRDLEVSSAAIVRLASLRPAVEGEVSVAQRVAAIGAFAQGAYFRGIVGGSGGASSKETDARVAELLKGAEPEGDKGDEGGEAS